MECDSQQFQITLKGQVIDIPCNTNQSELCRVVIKNSKTIAREWTVDEILEKLQDRHVLQAGRKMYTAARDVNDKVAIATGIKDFFITTTKSVRVKRTIETEKRCVLFCSIAIP